MGKGQTEENRRSLIHEYSSEKDPDEFPKTTEDRYREHTNPSIVRSADVKDNVVGGSAALVNVEILISSTGSRLYATSRPSEQFARVTEWSMKISPDCCVYWWL